MDHTILSELTLTSKDCKTLVPALISFLKNFERKFDTIFKEMKEDFQSKIEERDAKISDLNSEVKTLKEKVNKMEKIADDADAYERRDTLIFNGPSIPSSNLQENCSTLVQDLVKNHLNLNITATDISTAHRLGPKPRTQGPDNRGIVVKLCRRDIKKDILMASKNQSRPARLYVSESLTAPRRKVFNFLRFLRRQHPELIDGVSTFEGRVFAYTKNPAPGGAQPTRNRRHLVNDHDMLVEFCREFVKKPIESFLGTWNF